MSQISIPPAAIALGRPAVLRWIDDLTVALRAWHARWAEERLLVAQERALRHLDRRVLQDLGLPDREREPGTSLHDYEPARW
jgi:hypothetical protein